MNERPSQEIIQEIELNKAMIESFVEKDWFVVK